MVEEKEAEIEPVWEMVEVATPPARFWNWPRNAVTMFGALNGWIHMFALPNDPGSLLTPRTGGSK